MSLMQYLPLDGELDVILDDELYVILDELDVTLL